LADRRIARMQFGCSAAAAAPAYRQQVGRPRLGCGGRASVHSAQPVEPAFGPADRQQLRAWAI